MRRGQLLTLFILHLLQLLLLFCGTRAETEDPSTESICESVNCGQGQCKAENGTLFPSFECECLPGWKKVEIGPITLPPCVLPNCTINFDCGSVSPSPSPPPAPLLPSAISFLDPCSYTLCGDGSCVRTDGLGYICKCNEGSANLLNMSGLACVKPCSLGADCYNLNIRPFGPQEPPPSLSDAPNSRKDGWPKVDGSFARDQPVPTILLLLATFIPWI
ncbi:hypothetical protein MRB53_011965 [Persea americana]|uniref:Uncharacterized protein n=1 Tax=Persea americana TaxID=3435 RepID=A0ACC2LWW5_PERAE|nr:hypothetical protein MRB53_011965 [Persea americana]